MFRPADRCRRATRLPSSSSSQFSVLSSQFSVPSFTPNVRFSPSAPSSVRWTAGGGRRLPGCRRRERVHRGANGLADRVPRRLLTGTFINVGTVLLGTLIGTLLGSRLPAGLQ